jgi:hypothetical protein
VTPSIVACFLLAVGSFTQDEESDASTSPSWKHICQRRGKLGTYVKNPHQFHHIFLITSNIHDARSPATSQHRRATVFLRCCFEGGEFLPGGDVMRADQCVVHNRDGGLQAGKEIVRVVMRTIILSDKTSRMFLVS